MIDYWYYTGDAGNNKVITEAILAQVGENWDFNPSRQSHGMVRDHISPFVEFAMNAA